jgi:hypothetical protein
MVVVAAVKYRNEKTRTKKEEDSLPKKYAVKKTRKRKIE